MVNHQWNIRSQEMLHPVWISHFLSWHNCFRIYCYFYDSSLFCSFTNRKQTPMHFPTIKVSFYHFHFSTNYFILFLNFDEQIKIYQIKIFTPLLSFMVNNFHFRFFRPHIFPFFMNYQSFLRKAPTKLSVPSIEILSNPSIKLDQLNYSL